MAGDPESVAACQKLRVPRLTCLLSALADCQNYYQTVIIRMLVYEISGCLDYVGRLNAISKASSVRMCCFEFVDEPASEVHAFWEDDGTMTATIKTDSDVYYIEVGLVL